ncbi:MAG TPA: aerial mycelium formation protein [Actinomycetota bacterium]|nr:aerial mycelium formation protein [Actinomycetota bacterium]
MSEEHPANRRIDRIRDPSFLDGIGELSLDDVRARRDECMAEREYLSLLRRLVQGRAEILKAELAGRGSDDQRPLVDRLSEILASDQPATSRGEAMRVTLPEEEMLLARRRIERLVADAGISDPAELDDGQLEDAVEVLATEEREVSAQRADVLRVLDTLQDELKRRFKEDPTLALS